MSVAAPGTGIEPLTPKNRTPRPDAVLGAISRAGVRVSILPMSWLYLVTATSFAFVASRRRARSRITASDICGNWRRRSKKTSLPILSATTCRAGHDGRRARLVDQHAHLAHHGAGAELADLDAVTARAEPDFDLALDDHIGGIGDLMLMEQDVALFVGEAIAGEGEQLQLRRIDVAEHRDLPQGLHFQFDRHSATCA